jgi:acyl-CoA dehydrogenase
MSGAGAELTAQIAARVEAFVRDIIVPYEQDSRRDHHGAPTDELVFEMRDKARAAGHQCARRGQYVFTWAGR